MTLLDRLKLATKIGLVGWVVAIALWRWDAVIALVVLDAVAIAAVGIGVRVRG